MILPISQGQLGLDQSLLGELEKFSGSTVLSVKSAVHCRAHVEFGLQVGDMSETDVDTFRLEKWSGEKVVGVQRIAPQVSEVCTSFQN